MPLVLYNTLTQRKEAFLPANPPWVKIYVCGPTTYNFIHLGNARPLVTFDTLRRYLAYKGYKVIYVQNFTDIDDKIIAAAREEGISPAELAQKYIAAYFEDAQALNVNTATVHPRVTAHIPEIIAATKELIAKGYAYEKGGSVYFSVRKFPGYGKLSKRSLEEMLAGARVEVDPEKEDPLDFALWKASSPEEPGWPSPWGRGRPGWHIECAVMALKYLGPEFDIHAGGYDLVFPHHENEIAEAESLTERPFARYWLHNGFITFKEEKMSKSKGNFFLVREVLEKFPPEIVRFYLLSTHYRSPLDFDFEKLQVAQKSFRRLEGFLRRLEETLALNSAGEEERGGEEAEKLQVALKNAAAQFEKALDDDFNTALGLGALFELVREVNAALDNTPKEKLASLAPTLLEIEALFKELAGEVLGLFSPAKPSFAKQASKEEKLPALVEALLAARAEARKKKNWETADEIRRCLQEVGIAVEDTPQGTRWYWQHES